MDWQPHPTKVNPGTQAVQVMAEPKHWEQGNLQITHKLINGMICNCLNVPWIQVSQLELERQVLQKIGQLTQDEFA